MTDHELLELAAKASGYVMKFGGVCTVGDTEVDCTDIPYVVSDEQDEVEMHWNPLVDDGDALRLAVKLHFCVTSFTDEQMVGFVNGGCGHNISEHPGTDPYAATRRAIVMAAAEIGKTK